MAFSLRCGSVFSPDFTDAMGYSYSDDREKLIEARTSHLEHRKQLSMLRMQLRKVEEQDTIE